MYYVFFFVFFIMFANSPHNINGQKLYFFESQVFSEKKMTPCTWK